LTIEAEVFCLCEKLLVGVFEEGENANAVACCNIGRRGWMMEACLVNIALQISATACLFVVIQGMNYYQHERSPAIFYLAQLLSPNS
jgi:hypothetical protein